MSDDMDEGTTVEALTLTTSDGVDLEAEVAAPGSVTAAVVACHPHPLYGGTMDANVVEVLFRALPANGAAVLRFNFRGAGRSGGHHDEGKAEQLDVAAALAEATRRWPSVPLILAGYSFGADVALTVDDPAVTAWVVVAPPLRVRPMEELVALRDPRTKHVVAAAHDQVRPAAELRELLSDAPATELTVVEGADHFFAVGLGRIAEVATAALPAG